MSTVARPTGDLVATENGAKPYARVEFVTAERAAKLLQFNTHNRDLRISAVKAIAGAIRRGEFVLTGDCVVISGNGEDGVLLNGQHRLYAIVEAGIGVWLAILYNAAFVAQEAMDSGTKRTFGAKLKLRGEKYYNDLASAITVALAYDTNGIPRLAHLSARPTDQQMFAYLDQYPVIREWLSIGQTLRREFGTPCGSWAGLSFLCAKAVDTAQTETFFRTLVSGADLSEDDPIFVLRRLLMRELTKPHDRRYGNVLMAAMLIKAFNAYCLGQSMKILKWDSNREDFPKLIARDELSL